MVKEDLFERVTLELILSDKEEPEATSGGRVPKMKRNSVLLSHGKVSVGNEPGGNRYGIRRSGA